jgi:hypothetical protein
VDRSLPVVKIDEKNRIIGEPEWITRAQIIRTTSVRIAGKSVPAFETSQGMFMLATGVDDIPKLFEDNGDFIQVDRGSMINVRYFDGLDAKLKVAILHDCNGKEVRAEIAGGRLESIKGIFKKLMPSVKQ